MEWKYVLQTNKITFPFQPLLQVNILKPSQENMMSGKNLIITLSR